MVRLVINIILFLASLLCLIVAPTFHLWIASIAISEFSWIFLLVSMLMVLWSLYAKKLRSINTALGIFSLTVFALPITMAWHMGGQLPGELAKTFGGRFDTNSSNVFHVTRLFSTTPMMKYETISYAKVGDENLTLDYYQSTKKGVRPCVIVIHGGSWCGGNSQQLPELNSELARRGFQVVSVNYRLAPKHINPAPVEDITTALEYLKKNSAKLKIDTNNFILLGRSAGAQLAMITAYTRYTPGIRGVINFYGPTDMVFGYETPANPYVMDSRKVLEDFLGGPYTKVPHAYVSSSPVAVVSDKSVPTLIIHGANDALVSIEHAERLQQKLAANNIPNFMLSLPWATHGCDYTLNGPSGQLTTYAVEYFLNQVIKPVNDNLHITRSSDVKSRKSAEPVAYGNSGN